jgi:hypothetical protein
MVTMGIEAIKIGCDGLAALLAFGAGALWILASRQPVGTLSLPFWADSEGRLARATAEHNKKILRGAWLNKWAAFFTGLAALASCASWTIQFLIASASR